MDSSGLMSNFHLSARGKQLKTNNIIAILISVKLTFETLFKNVSKFSPTNVKYSPKQLRIIASKILVFLLN